MTTSLIQKIGLDPAPGNGFSVGSRSCMTGGTPSFMKMAYQQATVPGSALIIAVNIAFTAGTVVQGVSDAINGAWTQLEAMQTSGNCDCRLFVKPNALSLSAGDIGFATAAGSATTLVDNTKTWTTNQWAGFVVQDLLGNTRTVSSNTATTLTTSSGTTIGIGGYYVIGDVVTIQFSTIDDYNGVIMAEMGGAGTTVAGHSSSVTSVGSGTNNVTSGASGSLAAGNYGVFSFSFNDTSSTGSAPNAGTGQTDEGTYWVWNQSGPAARAQFRNTTLGGTGTVTSLFSSTTSAEYLTGQVVFADATSSTTITPNTGALVVVGQTPQLTNPVVIRPTAGTLSLAGQQPRFGGVLIVPNAGALILTTAGMANIAPVTAQVVLAGAAPKLTLGTVITPITGSLSAQGQPARVRPIDPITGAVALAGLQPQLILGTVIKPITGTLTTAGAAPIRTTSGSATIIPFPGSVTTAGQTASSVANTIIQAAAAVLAIVGQQPVETLTVPVPPAGAVIMQGFAPVVTVQSPSSNVSITPNAGAITVASGAAAAIAGTIVTPPAGSAAITGLAPTRIVGTLLQPAAGALVTGGVAPLLVFGTVTTPASGTLSLAGQTPQLQGNLVIRPNAGTLLVQGQQVGGTGSFTITPPAGALALTGGQPIQTLTVAPAPPAAMTLQGFAPQLVINNIVIPSTGALTASGQLVNSVANSLFTPQTAVLALSTSAPVLQGVTIITPQTGALIASGQLANLGGNSLLIPNTGALITAGRQVGVLQSLLITPQAGALQLSGNAPTIVNPVRIVPNAGQLVINGQPALLVATSPFTSSVGFIAAVGKRKRIAYFGIDLFSRD